MKERAKEGTLKAVNGASGDAAQPAAKKRPRRWDQTADDAPSTKKKSTWDEAEASTPSQARWDSTPGRKGAETPGATPGGSTRQWDMTPGHATPGATTPGRETPGQQGTPSARKNRWDETPKTERGIYC